MRLKPNQPLQGVVGAGGEKNEHIEEGEGRVGQEEGPAQEAKGGGGRSAAAAAVVEAGVHTWEEGEDEAEDKPRRAGYFKLTSLRGRGVFIECQPARRITLVMFLFSHLLRA